MVVTKRWRLLEPLLRKRDRFLLPLERQQKPPVHVRSRRDVADVSRRAVVPDHPVRQHGKIVTLCMLTFAKGTPAVHGIADHEVAVVVYPGPGRRKDTRLGHVIPNGFCVGVLLRKNLVCGEKSEGENNRAWPSAGRPGAGAAPLGQAHAKTSETTALESAKASLSTPTRWAMVSSRLLKCAPELTGLWYMLMPSP